MLVNPAIEEWFNNLHGKRLGAGGSAPRGTPQNYAAAAAEGIIKPSGMFDFRAPLIGEAPEPRPPAQSPALQAPSGIPVPFEGIPSGGHDLGGGAKAAGLEKLGQGIFQGLQALQAKRLAQQKAAAALAPYGSIPELRGPLGDQAARNPGATMPGAATYSPAPIGAASGTPIIAQPGSGIGETGASIGPTSALPTLAQSAPLGGPGRIAGNIPAARFNNPGDVSLPIAGWHGGGEIVGIKDQPGYAKFPDLQTGVNAFQHRVTNYIDSRGLNTIGALNSAYAKDRGWSAGVSAASGIGLNTPLDTSNQEQMRALQKGILSQEIGRENAERVLSGSSSPVTSPSASAFAAQPPSLTGPNAPQLAGPVPTQDTGEPRQISPGQPQTGPAWSGETWNNRPQYDYSGGQQPPAPLPPPRPQEQPPLINDGQPGVYDMPGQQGMNDQTNPLAAALAGGGDFAPLDQSAMLSMALAQPDFAPSSPDFSMPDFGGFLGGLFG